MLHEARRHLVHALGTRSASVAQRSRSEQRPGLRSAGTGSGLFLAVFVIGIALVAAGGILFESFGPAP